MSCPRCGFCITDAWGKKPVGNRCPLCYAEKGITVVMRPWSFEDVRRERGDVSVAGEAGFEP